MPRPDTFKQAVIRNALDLLETLNLGFLEGGGDRENELQILELATDTLKDVGVYLLELTLAIQYFLTDLPKARTYLYGPTDVEDGIGAIEKIKSMLL